MNKSDKIVIDISRSTNSPSLHARMVWEKLFRITQAERFANLDSFLCDLKIFEHLLAEDLSSKPKIFYWEYDSHNYSGYTEVMEYDITHRTVYKITVTRNEITIELLYRD